LSVWTDAAADADSQIWAANKKFQASLRRVRNITLRSR
jgi:hypothetical protein